MRLAAKEDTDMIHKITSKIRIKLATEKDSPIPVAIAI